MPEQLTSFIKFLDDNKLIKFSVLKDDTDEGFNNRLKAQKYAYIAQEKFNLDLNYGFSKYKFGPYSARLTDDYYGINIYKGLDEHDSFYETVIETPESSVFGASPLPTKFDTTRFLNLVSKKGEPWLEVAATIINVAKYNDYEKDRLIEIVNRIKPRFNRIFIEQVHSDLSKHGLMVFP